jgi:DNA (cytosine-5)-methyltransferase 1
LQTFPDTFVFPHSTTTNVMQIGNAVPPLLAHRVATAIHDYYITLGKAEKRRVSTIQGRFNYA